MRPVANSAAYRSGSWRLDLFRLDKSLWRRSKSYLLDTRTIFWPVAPHKRLTGIGAQYIEAPSQEVRHEIRSREIWKEGWRCNSLLTCLQDRQEGFPVYGSVRRPLVRSTATGNGVDPRNIGAYEFQPQ